MLGSFVALALVAGLATSVQGAITILYPTTDTVWYKNNTVAVNWTTSLDSDTYFFRALLSNQDQTVLVGNHSIADSTNATATYVRILLPGVPDGQGYVVNFVNTTDEAQVFATSQPFEIQEGVVTNTTSSSTSPSATSSFDIPNAASSAKSDPFATTAAASTTKTGGTGKSYLISFMLCGASALVGVAWGMTG